MKRVTQAYFDNLRELFMEVATNWAKQMYYSMMDGNQIDQAMKHMQKVVRQSEEKDKKN